MFLKMPLKRPERGNSILRSVRKYVVWTDIIYLCIGRLILLRL